MYKLYVALTHLIHTEGVIVPLHTNHASNNPKQLTFTEILSLLFFSYLFSRRPKGLHVYNCTHLKDTKPPTVS